MTPFEVAVRECLPALKRQALRLARNASDADDILQEALLRAFVAWRPFESGAHARPWLAVILKRCFLTELRRRKYRDTEIEVDGRDDGATAWHQYLDFQRAIAGLAPEFRAVLELAAEGLGHNEIAKRLQIPQGTSWSRLARARRDVEAALAA